MTATTSARVTHSLLQVSFLGFTFSSFRASESVKLPIDTVCHAVGIINTAEQLDYLGRCEWLSIESYPIKRHGATRMTPCVDYSALVVWIVGLDPKAVYESHHRSLRSAQVTIARATHSAFLVEPPTECRSAQAVPVSPQTSSPVETPNRGLTRRKSAQEQMNLLGRVVMNHRAQTRPVLQTNPQPATNGKAPSL